jgi:hypothetical protein
MGAMAPRRGSKKPRKPRKTSAMGKAKGPQSAPTSKKRARRKSRSRPSALRPARTTAGKTRAPVASARRATRGLATMVSDPIVALQLGQVAKRAAGMLKAASPSLVFTSGRRDKAGQARAMASNVVRNRQWIVETYRDTAAACACQEWVNDHPEATSQSAIGAGLLDVPNSLTDTELARLSTTDHEYAPGF